MLLTQDINKDKKFHPMRYYVVDREEAKKLISHATATWLDLVNVLCKNKAPNIKRQVASVSKKAKEPSDQNNNFLSGLQHPPKVKYSQMVTVKQPHSQGRHCRGKPANRKADGQLDHQSVKSHSFQADGNGASRVQSGQSMSPYKTITPKVQ